MTGAAPIYLVSACTSGEEFVAAFRRYADRSGLFIPISQPLATGRRSRFAVTLHNGGVMIEGEAEVISSATTASVLHGRVGMTLRFIAPDEASKITLGELERARLAMKPAPPSIPPRPAEIPAEPRPVPPPIQGRIDAVNALAECVAIGDPDPPLPLAAPARPGLKTMTGVPPMRPRSPSAPPPAASTPSPGAHPTGSLPVARTERAELPASPEPAPTDGAPVVERGPISDTYVSAMPPTPTELDLASPVAPRLASEMPAAVPRTPTKPGVTPAAGPAAPRPIASARDAKHSETMTAVPAHRPATPSSPTETGVVIADLAPRDPAIPVIEGVHDDPSARTQVSVSAPTPEPASSPPEIEIAEPTDLSAGPPEPTAPVAETADTAEIAEPQGASPDHAAATSGDTPATSPTPVPSSDEAGLRSRRTVLGILPARKHATSVPAAAVVAPAIPAVAMPDTSVEPHASAMAAATAAAAPASPRPGSAAAPVLPSGDWTIARDPEAPDGWTAPFTSGPSHHLGDPRGPLPPVVASAEPLDSNAAQPPSRPDDMPMLEPKVQIDPTLIEPLPGPLPGSLTGPLPEPLIEPLLQPLIDPMPQPLIDPLQAMPHAPYPIAPSPGMPGYGVTGALAEAPPMSMMMAVPQPGSYLMPQAAPMHAQMPGYATDPGYQLHGMPVPHDAHYASEQALRAATARRRAIIVLVSALAVVLIGIVVLLVSGDSRRPAGTSGGAAQPISPASRTSPRPPQSTGAVAADTAHAEAPATAATAAADPTAPAPESASAAETAPAPASSEAPAAKPAEPSTAAVDTAATSSPAGECFADVTSVPIGADIVIDQTNVIGMTPDRVELPCGAPVELLIRKGRLISATRTITPTPDGAKVKVTLGKQTLLVKVSSTPPGATITLYGRSLGVTPTTVKVPAFESSTLTLTKDGYAIATERVAPKVNGTAVHATLTRLERSRR